MYIHIIYNTIQYDMIASNAVVWYALYYDVVYMCTCYVTHRS